VVRDLNAIPILVTGAGAPGLPGTLYALRKNPDGRPVRVIGVDMETEAAGCFLVDKFFQVPAPEDPSYLDELLKICREESVAIVLPQTTREVVRLSQSKGLLEREGCRVMSSDASAIEIANNKWTLIEKFEEFGLPRPEAKLSHSEDEFLSLVRDLGYPERPVVVKPPISNGMRGVRVLQSEPWDVRRFLSEKPLGLETSLEELLRILRRGPSWPELLVMEYLAGPEYTVDAFIGEKLSVALPRLRQSVRSGITFRSRSEFRDDISSYTLQAARRIGLRYAFGFQFKLDNQGLPKILECNPRIQGTMVASVFSGANLIWYGVKELLGEPVEQDGQKFEVACFYRFWGGVGIAGEFVDEI
jgi:carbamoyl-phosphate synthase large subunit